MAVCFSCGAELSLPQGPVSRNAECQKCGADVRVCLNCKHHDRSAYNECREPQAERVLDKDRRNQCDFFSLRQDGSAKKGADPAADARKKLDDLFK